MPDIDYTINGLRVIAPDRESLIMLLQKLAKVSDFGKVIKDGRNEGQKFNYTSYEAFSAMLKARLLEEKLFFSLSIDDISNDRVEKEKVGGGTTVDTLSTVHGTAALWDTESGAVFSIRVAGTGQDFGDKSAYKAITGALKYGTMRLLLANDREADPDADDGRPSHTESTKDENANADSAEKKPAGDPKYLIVYDELSEDQRIIVASAKKHYEPKMSDEDVIAALGMHPKEYQGDRKTGFAAIGLWAKANGRNWKS